jgi:hypothetical protein
MYVESLRGKTSEISNIFRINKGKSRNGYESNKGKNKINIGLYVEV